MRLGLLLCAFIAAAGGCTTTGASHTAATSIDATDPAHLPLRANCTVQFKRDLLGASANLPVSPTTESINGVSVSVSGTLLSLDREWIVLKSGNGTVWVPRQNVLLLQFFE